MLHNDARKPDNPKPQLKLVVCSMFQEKIELVNDETNKTNTLHLLNFQRL